MTTKPAHLWTCVDGHPAYQVTTKGQVFHNFNWSKPLKQRDDGRGYRCITLDGTTYKVHRLVAHAFVPGHRDGWHVDHINHVKHDNRAINLRWRCPRENSADCHRGSRTGVRRLTDAQRAALVFLAENGFTTKAIADALHCGETTVRRYKRLIGEC